MQRRSAGLGGETMKKIYIYERRAGGDRRMFPRQQYGSWAHERRKSNGVLPVVLVPGRVILPRESMEGHIEH